MQYDKLVNKLLEDFKTAVQDFNTGYNIGMKQLTHNILNDPRGSVVGLLDVIKKTPGMYADLLTGKMDSLNQKFLQLGVDFKKIVNLVDQARELANKERMGQKVPVKRATPVKEQFSPNTLLDYFFEDLYNITDDRELMDKIRQRVETPEVKQKLDPAVSGDMVERIFMYIKNRRG